MEKQLELKRGDTWLFNIYYKDAYNDPIDISGSSSRMHIRDRDDGTLIIGISSASGEMTIYGASGLIQVNVANTSTTGVTPGKHITDIELTDSTGVVTSTETFYVKIIEDQTYG